ncbi:replication protein A 32 kDa subunit B isoform X2 [Prosopis cineraria]|uniref:replication protein A 32 kDa subunit B isoform X2 n=1 Tax=Prosopis cineraria TaxID=364024 RepID=UPI002410B03D|nr:replication protein A 32 kDa subunit B isoform X2 [Prosopis cineraria]
MHSSQFDGATAFSGGGFMPSQATQGPEPSFSYSKNRDAQSLLPLTVKQINDAFQSSDDKSNMIIDGVDVNNVTLVGRVCNKAGRITDVTFVLDDGTGRIECSKWLQEDADTNEAEGIRPLNDFNEIASHFIDCIYVHLYNTRIRSSVPKQQSMNNSLPMNPTRGYEPAPPNQFSGQHNNGQKNVEDMVLDILHLPSNSVKEEGVSRDLIAQHLGIPLDKLMLSIKNLIEEGAIYEAITDHYKSIING